MAVPEAIDGSQFIGNAKHLSSVLFLQHPNIIDDSLKKEEEIRCIFGSFTSPPVFFPAYSNVCHQNLFQMLSLCDRIVALIKTEYVYTIEANILIGCKTSLLASIHSLCTLKNVQNLYCYLFWQIIYFSGKVNHSFR